MATCTGHTFMAYTSISKSRYNLQCNHCGYFFPRKTTTSEMIMAIISFSVLIVGITFFNMLSLHKCSQQDSVCKSHFHATLGPPFILYLISLCPVNTAYKALGVISLYRPILFPMCTDLGEEVVTFDGDGLLLKRQQYIRLCCNNTQGPFTLLII